MMKISIHLPNNNENNNSFNGTCDDMNLKMVTN